jgi:hypothetical protein
MSNPIVTIGGREVFLVREAVHTAAPDPARYPHPGVPQTLPAPVRTPPGNGDLMWLVRGLMLISLMIFLGIIVVRHRHSGHGRASNCQPSTH